MKSMHLSPILLLLTCFLAKHGIEAFMNPSNFRFKSAPTLISHHPSTDNRSFSSSSTNSRGVQRSRSIVCAANNNDNDGSFQKLYDERPDKSILLSAQDGTLQQLGIAAILVGLGIGTNGLLTIYNSLEQILPGAWYDPFYSVLPFILSSAFIAAGIAHFVIDDTFTAFVPPKGTWGNLWNVPAPGAKQLGWTYEEYHCYWTGVAEIGGGLLLILTKLQVIDFIPPNIPAFLLFLLTIAVTPANIYMFTHDPDIPRIPPLPYPWGHAARGALQCALLAVFWKLSFHTY